MNNLGKTATDKVSGFTGTVTGIWNRLYGSTEVMIQSKVNDSGESEEKWLTLERVKFENEEGTNAGSGE